MHLFLPLVMVFELIINQVPFRKIHLIFIILLESIYMLVNYIYFKHNNRVLYPNFNYDNWISVIYIVVSTTVSVLVFLFSEWYTRTKKKI